MKVFTKTILHFLFTALFFSISAHAITRTSAASGDWANAASWAPVGIPACGDSVNIQATHTINLTTQQNYSGCGTTLKIVIYGKLKFYNGSKLRLPCGSYLIVYPGGLIEADAGLNNSNFIEICGNVVWNSSSPGDGPLCFPANNPDCQSFALPVELTEFNAVSCNKEICLNWETISENNCDHFEIERADNAINFRTILTIGSRSQNGNSRYKISYACTDQQPLDKINYYRLKQVDKDNKLTYSKIITVQLAAEKGLQFVIFPNINSGEFTAQVSGLRNQEIISVFLRDGTGAIVYKALHYVNDTSVQIRVVPALKLPNGIYLCTFIIGDTEHKVKIIVTNI